MFRVWLLLTFSILSLTPAFYVTVCILSFIGSYGRWHHLSCWRVPSKIWLGFPDDENAGKEDYAAVLRSLDFMLLSGFEGLPESDQDAVLEHCMKKENWAKLVKPKTTEITVVALELKEKEDTAVVPLEHNSERETFVIPEPGKDGAIPNALAGKVFVISGTFPEVIAIWLNLPTRSYCCEVYSLT